MDELLERLATIATQMNALRRSSLAQVNYDMLADAFWWTDERPDFRDAEDHWCLRPVFRYRTTLILDAPEPQWKPYWDHAHELFPAWPGFHAARTAANPKLADFHYRKHDAAIDALEEIPD